MSELESVMHFHELPRNSSLLPEQDQIAFLLIKAGELSVSILLDDGRALRLCVLRSGEIMCPHHYYSVVPHDIRARRKAHVGLIFKEDFEMLTKQDPSLAAACTQWHQWLSVYLVVKMRDLTLFRKKGALASTLMRLVNAYGKLETTGVRIDCKITNDELAQLIGSTRESVNRNLMEFKRQSVISFDKRQIIVHDVSSLQSAHQCLNCSAEICRL